MAEKIVETSCTYEEIFLDKRIIMLDSSINEKTEARILQSLLRLQHEAPDKPAYILIDSRGGELWAALRIFDAIEHLFTIPVHAVVIGECSSAAIFVLLACERRFATPHARFILHHGTMSGIAIKTDDLTTDRLRQLQTEIERDTAMVADLHAEKLKKSVEEVKRLFARGDQPFNDALYATDALEIGLITEIVQGKLPFFAKQESAG